MVSMPIDLTAIPPASLLPMITLKPGQILLIQVLQADGQTPDSAQLVGGDLSFINPQTAANPVLVTPNINTHPQATTTVAAQIAVQAAALSVKGQSVGVDQGQVQAP